MTTPFAELVTIGTVVKPQGRRGEVAVAPLSDRPDRFAELRRAFVPGPDGSAREVQVESAWPHKGRFVLKLAGVDSIDEAERYRGLDLRIPETELAPLPEGSYYHHQLKGLTVVDESAAEWGRVADLLETGAATVLVIRGEDGETLLPLADAFVRRVDVAHGRLVAARPVYVEAR